ncbi:PLP-dependent aminotransferase family protein [Burkholderia sp. Bp9131]|nr:PLP-dependent aminotransferase family protein [Burkholderia sp. Bp9131]
MTWTRPIGWWIERIANRTAQGIAVETAALIRSGALPVGSQLPPVRELAEALGVSPATISGAWSELRRYKVISGQGRNGVWVSGDKASPRPQRFEFEFATAIGQHIVADLSLAGPDTKLLPDLSRAMAAGLKAHNLNEYERAPILGELEDTVRSVWPYGAESMVATNGGFEAIFLALQALVQPGAVVAIEDPSASRILDILEYLRAQVIAVPRDNEGPDPEALRHALKRKPSLFVFEPRTHATTGTAVSETRMEALAKVLEGTDTLVLEDDGLADASSNPSVSLGRWLPAQTIHIVSYSKAFGPDLRVAVLSSTSEIAGRIQSFRNFGARWSSRILQGAVAYMLKDEVALGQVQVARLRYSERRAALKTALLGRKVVTHSQDGFCLWIPVESEQFALLTMAARGIAVFPGSRFCISKRDAHIRVGISRLTSDFDAVADAIALATRLT